MLTANNYESITADARVVKGGGMSPSDGPVPTKEDEKELWDPHAPPKTINKFQSFALITNNICGPAMMSLPTLFRAAGFMPTVTCILIVFVCTSLCGTFLTEAIQQIPGNREFRRNLDFAQAFRIVAGEQWYHPVQILVIVSCLSQIFAAIVETSQALDSFLASFVIGKTYALQFSTMSIIEWSSYDCSEASHAKHVTDEGVDLDLCTPFADADFGIVTLGYVLMTVFFMPLGLGDLKETMIVQMVAFLAFFVFLYQFEWEFAHKGYNFVDTVPWVGDDYSSLAGVVLFNYAYPITVPSWLSEKKTNVPVNSLIWGTSALSTVIYIIFGLTAAFAFSDPGTDTLIVLASSQVTPTTRIMAAFFGVCIIGCGAPVFCVIVHNQLASDAFFSPSGSMFIGCIMPYLVSMWMYQGDLLMSILNWTGLVVNGTVASILPLVLAYLAYKAKVNTGAGVNDYNQVAEDRGAEAAYLKGDSASQGENGENGEEGEVDVVKPLPPWLEPYRGSILVTIIAAFTFTIVGTLVLDIVTGAEPPS